MVPVWSSSLHSKHIKVGIYHVRVDPKWLSISWRRKESPDRIMPIGVLGAASDLVFLRKREHLNLGRIKCYACSSSVIAPCIFIV